MTKKTPYETLGVKKNASRDEIKKAMKEKAKKTHPDKGGSEDEMKEVNKAYAILINPEKRKNYDETGDESPRQTFESRFLSLLNRIFLSIVEQYDEEEIKYEKITDDVKKRLSGIRIELSKDLKEKENKFKKNQEVYNRIKNKEESLIGIVMKNEIDMLEQQINGLKTEQEFIAQCEEKAKEFDYNTDDKTEEYLLNKMSKKYMSFR